MEQNKTRDRLDCEEVRGLIADDRRFCGTRQVRGVVVLLNLGEFALERTAESACDEGKDCKRDHGEDRHAKAFDRSALVPFCISCIQLGHGSPRTQSTSTNKATFSSRTRNTGVVEPLGVELTTLRSAFAVSLAGCDVHRKTNDCVAEQQSSCRSRGGQHVGGT